MKGIKKDIKDLLTKYPLLRDDTGDLTITFLVFRQDEILEIMREERLKNKEEEKDDSIYRWGIRNKIESSVTRLSADIQRNNPELRWEKWEKRQEIGNEIAKTYTVSEDVSYIFQKETFWEYIKRYFIKK